MDRGCVDSGPGIAIRAATSVEKIMKLKIGRQKSPAISVRRWIKQKSHTCAHKCLFAKAHAHRETHNGTRLDKQKSVHLDLITRDPNRGMRRRNVRRLPLCEIRLTDEFKGPSTPNSSSIGGGIFCSGTAETGGIGAFDTTGGESCEREMMNRWRIQI